ncbi:MAG: lysophospholipid acyltransferase family protein [Anaerolineales bacterium]
MDLQEFLKQRWVIIAVLGIVRLMPRRVGYAIIDMAARRISRQKPRVYQQLRRNIAHIPGTDASPERLDQLTSRAFLNAGRFYFDFYHLVQKPVRQAKKQVRIPEEVYEKIAAVQQSGRGVVLAGMHTGNFDLGMVALAADRLEITALSASNPNDAYKVQNKLRTKSGLELLPITPGSLKKAIRLLRDGGIVATGMDWPHPEETCHTEVFGKPAYVPLGTARLALLSNAVTMVVSFYRKPDGTDSVTISEPIEVIHTGDREKDIAENTAAYMKIFEEFVQQNPDQWMMYHEFWVA